MVAVDENNNEEYAIESITHTAETAGSRMGLRPPAHLAFQSKNLAAA